METIAKKLQENQNYKWYYCFEVKTTDNQIFYRVSSNKNISISGKKYLANNALKLEYFFSDESGKCYAIITGFFDNNGIYNETTLDEAEIAIKLYLCDDKILQNWLTLYVTTIETSEDKFSIKAESLQKKYSANLTKFYSKRCRAKFGDNKCKINISNFPGENCDKSFTMCCNKYNNAINFRGEPFIPTIGYFEGRDE